MAEEKTFPMTLEGKQKLEQELEDLKMKRRPEVIKRIKIAAKAMVTFLKTLNMSQQRMNKPLLKDEFHKLKICFNMLKSLIMMMLTKMKYQWDEK